MSPISSNTLFHFVTKREYLIDILKNNFKPRYCQELVSDAMPVKDTWWDRVIPMKCFCDLTLSTIAPHLGTYGQFGIGMTKEWGLEKGFTPLLYVHGSSPLIECVRSSVGSQAHRIMTDDPTVEKLANEFKALINYAKPYVGSFKREGVLHENVRFYNEREWRFVPADCDVFDSKDIDDSILMAAENEKVALSSGLEFSPDDVRYLIVPSDDEILPLHRELIDLKGGKYTMDSVHRLQTRIISATQIRDDF